MKVSMDAYPHTADRIRAPGDLTPTSISLPPDVPKLEKHDAGEHRKQEERDSGALAEVAARQSDLVRERGEEVRRVDRTAAREYLDNIEVGEGEDRREQDHDGQNGLEQRQGHVA